MKNDYFRCLSLALFLSPLAAAQIAPDTPPATETFQRIFESYIENSVTEHTPGLALAVVIDGKPALTQTYGVRRVGRTEPIDADTVFRLGSVSKTFASAAVGTLVQNGKLDWDNKITDYLREVRFVNPQYTRQLTLRHLLSHTSGLLPHAYTNLLEENLSYSNILKKMEKVPFVCAPGKCYGYQNIVYSLAGDVIEVVSNDSFEHIVQRNLFDPLAMKDASYGLNAFVTSENHVTPHVWNRRRKQWMPARVNNDYYKVPPAAGANASINDMRQWLMAQLGHRQDVLPSAILDRMHGREIRTSRRQAHYGAARWRNLERAYYGLGWRVFDYGGERDFIHHGGWVRGFRSEMIFNPKLQMGMVMLTNSETSFAGEIVPEFLRLYMKYVLAGNTKDRIVKSDP